MDYVATVEGVEIYKESREARYRLTEIGAAPGKYKWGYIPRRPGLDKVLSFEDNCIPDYIFTPAQEAAVIEYLHLHASLMS